MVALGVRRIYAFFATNVEFDTTVVAESREMPPKMQISKLLKKFVGQSSSTTTTTMSTTHSLPTYKSMNVRVDTPRICATRPGRAEKAFAFLRLKQ